MSDGHDDRRNEALADLLIRRYGASAPSRGDASGAGEADPNDVAAYVHGGLLPAQRARFGRTLLTDPLLRDQVDFEAARVGREVASHRRRWTRRALAGAAVAAAAILLAVVPPLLDGPAAPEAPPSAEALLAEGRPSEAIGLLESREALDPDAARLLVLARYAAGQGDPLRALEARTLPEGTRDLLPLSEDEMERLALAARSVVRNGGADRAESVVRPRGMILAGRPVATVHPGSRALELVVYRNHDQKTIFRRRIPGVSEPGTAVRVRYPVDVDELEPGVQYGLELRTLEDALVAHASFRRAGDDVAALCRTQSALLDRVLPDLALRKKALTHLYLRHDLFADALEALRAVPAEGRDASWRRLHALASDLLGR